MNFRLGELFCGPGGLGLGATQAAFTHNNEKFSVTHEWASDYDKDTCETYRHNIAGKSGSVIHKDIQTDKCHVEGLLRFLLLGNTFC
ncbi:MAG: DNA cytosine methyltransferase [Ekhidna sp.]|nr:DNA cytosine methyltransferase [Ekhidna sp.]MBC6409280.1 DNA cytosine methyltransferase [Ekhidna sp.]MBC6427033.1 DNA cytosine methyltransferase [Ekhidna sp.]